MQCNTVSVRYFETLGVKAELGRIIGKEDDAKPGSNPRQSRRGVKVRTAELQQGASVTTTSSEMTWKPGAAERRQPFERRWLSPSERRGTFEKQNGRQPATRAARLHPARSCYYSGLSKDTHNGPSIPFW
jgi:hypothetical protein